MNGALTQAPARRTGCAGCGAPEALSITVSAKNTPSLTMTSCPRCEHRQWADSSGTLTRDGVLQLLSGRDDFVFEPLAKRRRS